MPAKFAALAAAVLVACSAAHGSEFSGDGSEGQPPPVSQAVPSEQAAPPATSSSTLTPAPENEPQVIEALLSEYTISLSVLSVRPGRVRFVMQNVGARRHDLRVQGEDFDQKSAVLTPGASGVFDVTLTEPGVYEVFCDIGNHRDQGMVTTLVVSSEG
jgi:plastocyanin